MKNVKWKRSFSIIGFLVFVMSSPSFAQNPPQPPPPPIAAEDLWRIGLKPLPVEKVSPGVFRLGEVKIYKETRSIEFPGQVNMDKGLLEYILVRSSGKTHESLFRTDVDPYHLQIAFLLLGFEGTDKPIAEQGSEETPKGDPVEITIDYMKKGSDTVGERKVRIKTEEWVVKKINNSFKDVGKLNWVYTGSAVIQGQFLAQSGGSIIAIYHDPAALIDNASPGGESDEIWFVKEGSVPPVGTPVTVTIKAKR
jgi:hypothetical protein